MRHVAPSAGILALVALLGAPPPARAQGLDQGLTPAVLAADSAAFLAGDYQ